MTPEEYLAALIEWADTCERYATARLADAKAARAGAARHIDDRTQRAAMSTIDRAEVWLQKALDARSAARTYRDGLP